METGTAGLRRKDLRRKGRRLAAITTAAAAILLILLAVILPPSAAQAQVDYRYAFDDCEYTIKFPEAPAVATVWAEDPLPFWTKAPRFGAVGERALYATTEIESGDILAFESLCVISDAEIFGLLDEKAMQYILTQEYQSLNLSEMKTGFKESKAAKWASLSGLVVLEGDRVQVHYASFIAGRRSLMLVKGRYSAGNDVLAGQFNKVLESITYNYD